MHHLRPAAADSRSDFRLHCIPLYVQSLQQSRRAQRALPARRFSLFVRLYFSINQITLMNESIVNQELVRGCWSPSLQQGRAV